MRRGFSAPGARETVKDLRSAKSELSDEDFGRWLGNLDAVEIPKLLIKHHFAQKKQV